MNIPLQASKSFIVFYAVAHLFVLLLAIILLDGVLARAACIGLIVFSAVKCALLVREIGNIDRLVIKPSSITDGTIAIVRRGQSEAYLIAASSRVFAWGILLNLHGVDSRNRVFLPILFDAVSANDLRLLRKWLRDYSPSKT